MFIVFIRTVVIYVLIIVVVRLMGKRQIGELEVNELVSTLLISEIGALPISDTDIPLLPSLIPSLFIASAEVMISIVKNKSALLKRAVEGEPTYIIYKGRVLQKALDQNRISINEVLTEMRTQGIANLSDVYYGILEQNGKLSLTQTKNKDSFAHPIILDRVVDEAAMRHLGYNDQWLNKELKQHGLKLDEVFLMTVNDAGKTEAIRRELND